MHQLVLSCTVGYWIVLFVGIASFAVPIVGGVPASAVAGRPDCTSSLERALLAIGSFISLEMKAQPCVSVVGGPAYVVAGRPVCIILFDGAPLAIGSSI